MFLSIILFADIILAAVCMLVFFISKREERLLYEELCEVMEPELAKLVIMHTDVFLEKLCERAVERFLERPRKIVFVKPEVRVRRVDR